MSYKNKDVKKCNSDTLMVPVSVTINRSSSFSFFDKVIKSSIKFTD